MEKDEERKEENFENLNDEKVVLENFKQYEEAEDGITKKEDGELKVESFHLYEGKEKED